MLNIRAPRLLWPFRGIVAPEGEMFLAPEGIYKFRGWKILDQARFRWSNTLPSSGQGQKGWHSKPAFVEILLEKFQGVPPGRGHLTQPQLLQQAPEVAMGFPRLLFPYGQLIAQCSQPLRPGLPGLDDVSRAGTRVSSEYRGPLGS